VVGSTAVTVLVKMTTGPRPMGRYDTSKVGQPPQSKGLVEVTVLVNNVLVGPKVNGGKMRTSLVQGIALIGLAFELVVKARARVVVLFKNCIFG
jgi:hypothetical protein